MTASRLPVGSVVLLLVVMLLPLAAGCGSDDADDSDWSVVESATGEDLMGVWGSGPTDVWAVGENGTIVHWDGSAWSSAVSNTSASLHAIWGSGTSDVWAVGGVWDGQLGTGTIAHFDGTEWSEVLDDAPQPLVAVWGTSADNVYAIGGADADVYIAQFDGTSWEELASPPDDPDGINESWVGTGVWGTGPNNLYVTTFNSVVHFDGSEWSYLASGLGCTFPADSVWGTSETNVFVGQTGSINRWDGENWSSSLQIEPIDEEYVYFSGIWGTGDTDVFAVGGYWGYTDTAPSHGFAGGACIQRFDGVVWTEHNVRSLASSLAAVWGASTSDVWAVGDGGSILRYRP